MASNAPTNLLIAWRMKFKYMVGGHASYGNRLTESASAIWLLGENWEVYSFALGI
jgi:hypothetical protein